MVDAGTKDRMRLRDDTDSDRELLERAAQYDLALRPVAGAAHEEGFGWCRKSQELGPHFSSRRLALDWITRWLEEDTPSQGLHIRA